MLFVHMRQMRGGGGQSKKIWQVSGMKDSIMSNTDALQAGRLDQTLTLNPTAAGEGGGLHQELDRQM